MMFTSSDETKEDSICLNNKFVDIMVVAFSRPKDLIWVA